MWLKLHSRTGKAMLVDISKITHMVKVKTGTELYSDSNLPSAQKEQTTPMMLVQETLESIASRIRAKAV